MPTIAANAERWTTHQWVAQGDEWSPGGTAAGTDLLWWRTLLPRIRRFVPARTVLEIGPGYGRWTNYLKSLCGHLVAIDVTPGCIDACRVRFAGDPHLEFHVNDGTSLDVISDHTIDFVFSFDSLVHAEADVLDRYIKQLPRILTPGGAAFIHHSNLGAFVDPRSQRVKRYVTRQNWRAASMSARKLREACRRAGLRCTTQEMINWIGRGRNADRPRLDGKALPVTDCLSIITNAEALSAAHTHIVVNHGFVDEWRSNVWLATAYPPAQAPRVYDTPVHTSVGRKLSTAASLVRRPASFARVARDRTRSAVRAARAWTVGEVVKAREPYGLSLHGGRCPDCGRSLDKSSRCRQCDVTWMLANS